MRYRHHLVFEFHLPRFLRRMSLPRDHPGALHPCLRDAIYLMGCHLARGLYEPYELYFLPRVRQGLSDSLAMAQNFHDFITANAMLARWYLCTGRVLEAYHQSACEYNLTMVLSSLFDNVYWDLAVAQFALSCHLDKIASPLLLDAPVSILGPPRDAIDLGERVNTFWSIVALDKMTALTAGLPNTIDDNVCTALLS